MFFLLLWGSPEKRLKKYYQLFKVLGLLRFVLWLLIRILYAFVDPDIPKWLLWMRDTWNFITELVQVLAALVKLSTHAVWFDLDILVLSDPVAQIQAALEASEDHLIFARHQLSQSVSPALIVARGCPMAASILMGYAGWLRENPYLLDHQGWDQYLSNNNGDFAGLFDYKGRNTTNQDPNGPDYTFLASRGLAPEGTQWTYLTEGFGSGDGWQGDASDLVFFHFWGASESQLEMFEIFYQGGARSLSKLAMSTILKYRKEPVSAPTVPALLMAKRKLHIIAISYAHGCCTKSLKRNRDRALQAGVDEARSYGKEHLGPDWQEANSRVLSQKRGGGWWLWKPYVILQTLKDTGVCTIFDWTWSCFLLCNSIIMLYIRNWTDIVN